MAEDSERSSVVAVLAEGDQLAAANAERGGGSCVDEITAGMGLRGGFRVHGVHWFTVWMTWAT